MTAPDHDPVTIAREVVRQHGHLDRGALSRREKERLDLARAVIDLTNKVEHVEALADRLEHEAAYEAARGDDWDAECIRFEARRIREALTEAEKGNTP